MNKLSAGFVLFVLSFVQMVGVFAESFDVDAYTFDELLIIQELISDELLDRYSDVNSASYEMAGAELDEIECIALDSLRSLQAYLLNPDSIIVYSVYVNQDYNGMPAAFIHFGSQNRMGGISEDEVFIQRGNAQFKSEFDEAVEAGNNDAVIANGDYALAQYNIFSGKSDWLRCDTTRVECYLD